MSHDHNHSGTDRGIRFGLVLNSLYTIVEFTFGIITGSLALIADATHNLTDTFTLAVSFIANRLAKREANESKTFGYGRATILAALLNASVMFAIAIFISIEAFKRIQNPVEIEGGIVALVASVGILVNGSIAYVLSKNRDDLNMRSAYIDMAFDALSSLGAVIAGLLMLFTDLQYVDTFVGLLIAALLLFNTIKILKEAVHILLEGTPVDIDIESITAVVLEHEKVLQVDDMHVWAIRSGYNALSCHIVVDEAHMKDSRKIVEDVKANLRSYNVHHSTIEVELEENSIHKEHERH